MEDDENVFIKCGIVLGCNGSEENVLYFVNKWIFEEVEEDLENEDEIMQWGDGKYYKRVLLGFKKKLKNKVLELESEHEECRKELKKCGKRRLLGF